MDKKRFAMGALPRPDLAWQMGKTAASIGFVRDAENMIEWLQERVEEIKKGELVLYDEVDINVFGWDRALEEPSLIEQAQLSFWLNYHDDNMWGSGIGMKNGEEVIEAYVVDLSKVKFLEEYEGFKVVVVQSNRPTPLDTAM